jgi:hypothetical protein
MFKRLGKRTLMACPAVALMALITQQNLAAQSKPPTVTLTLNNSQPINVTEGKSFTLFYTLKNQSSQEITLGNPPDKSNFITNHQTGGTDPTDNLSVGSVTAWKQGTKIVLEGSEVSGIQAEFNTPAIPENEGENKDRGEWGVSLRFDPGTYPNPTQGGSPLPLPSVLANADVFVNDPGVSPVVPEPSNLILVAACGLSVCGFGWLRRRKIFAKA